VAASLPAPGLTLFVLIFLVRAVSVCVLPHVQFLDLVNADRRREDAMGGGQVDDDIHEDVGSLLDEQASRAS